MRWILAVGISVIALASAFGQSAGQQRQAEIKYALEILQSHSIPSDGNSLLKFFRDRTLSLQDQKQLATLVERLGDKSYQVREKASNLLLKAGQLALPFLKEGLTTGDAEVVRRSEICLNFIAERSDSAQVMAAVQVLTDRHPANAARVLLEYLPFAADENVIDQIRRDFPRVATRNGKTPPVVLSALKDTFAVKRAVVGESLAHVAAHRPAVLDLLKDPNAKVRLNVALALTRKKEPQAVPVLITLLEELPLDQAWQAEEMLYRLAGDKAPKTTLDRFTPSKKVREGWESWWGKHRTKANEILAKLEDGKSTLGYTLVTQMSLRAGTNGQVMELDRGGNVRWKIEGLRYPVDAQVVGPNRVLVVEYLNNCVTERDFKNKILWTKQVSLPVGCQRLRNGNTFVVTRRQLYVVDRQGRDVFTHRPNQSISAAKMLPGGQIIMVTSGGQCIRIDKKGKHLKTFQSGRVYTMGGSIDVLPTGRVLIPDYRQNRVVEYTPDGKEFWSAPVNFPTSAMRLANGNTLVVSMLEQRVVELNRAGKTVWQQRTNGRPWRARRR